MPKKSSLAEMAMATKKPGKAVEMPVKEHLNAKIDKKLLKNMRVFCAMNEITIQDFLADAIRKAIKDAEGK